MTEKPKNHVLRTIACEKIHCALKKSYFVQIIFVFSYFFASLHCKTLIAALTVMLAFSPLLLI